MINNNDMVNDAVNTIRRMKIGDLLIYKTFKKDRKVEILKIGTGYEIREDGYEHQVFSDLDEKEVKKRMRELKDREFPRSNRVWNQLQKKE